MGAQGTLKHFPLAKCKNNNPVLELKSRFTRKIKDGYTIIQHETKLP